MKRGLDQGLGGRRRLFIEHDNDALFVFFISAHFLNLELISLLDLAFGFLLLMESFELVVDD